MATTQTEEATDNKPESAGADTTGKSQIVELSTESFKAFCEDISAMFSINMRSNKLGVSIVKTEALQGNFKNLVAITSCEATGALEGTFQIIFSREGLFTLAGAISMPAQMTSMLEQCVGPEKTMKNIKSGSLKEAEGESDTIAEACNLLIGSWDRIFRDGLEGHEHLLQTNNFIGDPWDNPKEKTGMASDEEYLLAPHKITISSFPAFDCGVIFPKTIFSKVNAQVEEKAKTEAEEKAKTEAEEKAKAEAEEKAKAEIEVEPKKESDEKSETKTEVKAEAGSEEKAKDEAEEKPQTETEAKAETEAKIDEKTSAPEQSQEPPKGKVSETIQKMAQSPATLPGESGKATIANIDVEACATDIMQKEVVWATSEESVQQAMTKMQQQDSGYIMIGKDGVLEGIVSKSDITGATSIYLRPIFAKWYGPLDDATLQIKLKWIMSRPVRTIKPETPLATIIENICRFGGRGLPVVDDEGKVQGLVTVFDIFRTLLNTSENVSAVGKTAEAPALV
ncbi:MAG: CBS domain-containing protein [Sedimentisphaerales bacterium]|nr:CBS domain-containing protein [Sedimentisphaerales bacterium]